MVMFSEIIAAGMELALDSRLEPKREGKYIKPVFWPALILRSQGKKTTRQTLFVLLLDRGCDIESLPAVATEGAVCNISYGHLDDAINCAGWRHTHDASATEMSFPPASVLDPSGATLLRIEPTRANRMDPPVRH